MMELMRALEIRKEQIGKKRTYTGFSVAADDDQLVPVVGAGN